MPIRKTVAAFSVTKEAWSLYALDGSGRITQKVFVFSMRDLEMLAQEIRYFSAN